MLRSLLDQVLLTWRLLQDPRVPLWSKIIPFLPLIYVISPLDFIPDFLIGLGQLDDLGLVVLGLRLFESAAPDYVVEEHRRELKRRHKPLEVIEMPRFNRSDDKAKRRG